MIVWVSGRDTAESLQWLVDLVEHLPTGQWGMLLTGEQDDAELLQSSTWSHQLAEPGSFEELLTRLASIVK